MIGTGTTREELGDLLLPYVVASDAKELERLRQLGVDVLEDAASAEPRALARALRALGERLSAEAAQEQILDQPGRRRLVRGAIQEIYRALNQTGELPPMSGLKLVSRTGRGLRTSAGPFYFADPGSAVERGFLDHLPLIDVDRAYPRLFQAIGVTRLAIGQTVDEILADADRATQIEHMRTAIVEELAPLFVALLLVRADIDHASLVARRFSERFTVFAMPRLSVSLVLRSDPEHRVTVEFPHAYLRKYLEPARGAIEEAHYSLYVAGQESLSLLSVDGDALGDALEPVCLDGIGDELVGLFPRIVTRYQHHRGDRAAIERFLLFAILMDPQIRKTDCRTVHR